MNIVVINLIADLHTDHAPTLVEEALLRELALSLGQSLPIINAEELPQGSLPLIFVRSGGTEDQLQALYQDLPQPYLLLTTGLNNSLAASLEMLTFLKQRGKEAEILHGEPAQIAHRIRQIVSIYKVKSRLRGMRIGTVGKPSDWLIASYVDPKLARERLGVDLIDIEIPKLIEIVDGVGEVPADLQESLVPYGGEGVMEGALRIYLGLKRLVQDYALDALTLRCFDLLPVYNNTGCLALSFLNDEGITAGCEGDVPALLSMVLMQALTEEAVFMANPSEIDGEKNMLLAAHCTVPLSITEDYSLHSHFESGLGIGIRGKIRPGACTVFKLSNDLRHFFISAGEILENLERENLCRTQLRVKLEQNSSYFFRQPLGNHHLLCRGDHSLLLAELCRELGMSRVL